MFQSHQFSYYSKTNNPYTNGMRPRGFFSERRNKIIKDIMLSDPTKESKKEKKEKK